MDRLISFDYLYKNQSRPVKVKVKKLIFHSSNSAALKDRKLFLSILRSLQTLTGQSPYLIRTKKSVASFSSREDSEIAVGITLRKDAMVSSLCWLSSDVWPLNSNPTDPLWSPLNSSRTSSLGLGLQESSDLPRISIEPSLALMKFGLDLELGISGDPEDKNFIGSYLGLPLRVVK